ncbi:alpha/beta hydrolase [Candidatus Viridilinea mediisalina]|uniref:Alpha/beta hydrolase n=2 Tax=Candidatus Viridilinea mediisalina TaxID=2024553 RepID=A0A2A6REF5_9CHLR|nr:alpha/beta hydrolase [Candidatus Viridilinea mediisalina]
MLGNLPSTICNLQSATHYLDMGGPPTGPVLHLAPANGFPPESYQPLVAALRPNLRAIGYRPRPLWPGSHPDEVHTWHDLACDLLRDLATVSSAPVIGVGHSLGGILSLYAAVRHPERFRALVLLDPVIMPRPMLPLLWVMRRLGQHHRFPLAQGAARRRDHFSNVEEARRRLQGRGAFAHFTPAALEGYLAGGLRPDPQGGYRLAWPRTWEAHIFALVPIDTWKALSRLQVPLMIIRGTKSDLMINSTWRQLAQRLPQAQFVDIPAGHMLPMEAPEAVATALNQWLGKST